MVKIYILRHGHSLGNEKNLITGHYDCDLSETGKIQAKLACEYIVNTVKPDKLYSSPLCRAVHTITPAAQEMGIEIIKEPAFKELSAGKWEGIHFDDALKTYPKEFTAWLNGEGRPIDGEIWEDVFERVVSKIKEIILENDGKKIVIATHGGVIKVLQCYFSNMKLTEINDIDWVSNASITEVWCDGNSFEIKRVNDDSFLGDIKTKLPETI